MNKRATTATGIICIGASMGGLDRISSMIRCLKGRSQPVVVVLHLATEGENGLLAILAAETRKRVLIIQDKMPIEGDVIYIAPADYHSLVNFNGTFTLDASERVSFARPSIDVMFESCAMVFGSQCWGVILSGANSDGSNGMIKIRAAGGLLFVEDPELADFPQMPQSVLASCEVHHRGSVAELGKIIAQLSQGALPS